MRNTAGNTRVDDALRDVLAPGQSIVVGQASGTPQTLIDGLGRNVDLLQGSVVYLGMLLGEFPELPGTVIRTFFPSGPLADAGELRRRNGEYLRRSLYELSADLRAGDIRVDVLLAQATEVRAGCRSLGTNVDYVAAAAARARAIVLETGPAVPWTGFGSTITNAIGNVQSVTIDASPVPIVRRVSDVDLAIARNLDEWIPDRATVQLGMAGWVAPLADRLGGRQGLRVHSGLISDWIVGLDRKGALDPNWSAVGTGAGGTRDFYDWLDRRDVVELRPAHITHRPEVIAELRDFRAVNSVLEVDLVGRANSEHGRGGRLGGIAGLWDFAHGAAGNDDGLSIIALPSCRRGRSTIVPLLRPQQTSLASELVDIIVTEQGSRDLRGLAPKERAVAVLALACPEHRAELNRAAQELEVL